MQKTELYMALTDVIATFTGRSPDEIVSTHGRDIDDPAIWRRPKVHQNGNDNQRQSDDSTRRYQRTHTRKSRLTDRLYRDVAAITLSNVDHEDVDAELVPCYQDLIVASRLTKCGHAGQSRQILQRVLKRAAKHDDPLLALLALRDLFSGSDSITRDRNRLEFQRMHQQWTQRYFAHQFFSVVIDELLLHRRFREDHSLLAYIDESIEETQRLPVPLPLVYDRLINDVIQIRRAQIAGLNDKVLKVIRRCDKRLATTAPHSHRWLRHWTVNAALRAYLARGETERLLVESAGHVRMQSTRPHLIVETARLRLVALMRLGRWDEAISQAQHVSALLETTEDAYEQQRCLLIFSYIGMCHRLGIHEHAPTWKTPRLTTFLNSVPLLSEDRGGLNFYVLIYDILHHITAGDNDTAERKVFNLNVCASRNLNRAQSRPLRSFITFLRVVTHYDLNDPRVRARTIRYLNRMEADVGDVPEHLVSPVPLRVLAEAVMLYVDGRSPQTRV